MSRYWVTPLPLLWFAALILTVLCLSVQLGAMLPHPETRCEREPATCDWVWLDQR